MRFSLLLLASLVVVASGCDSVEEAETAGPTIQFGAASVGATEGDTGVEIPVKLTNGVAGQSYTVEVLLAVASSSAAFGTDVANFGAAAGANRVATVTLTGETDTEAVTIDVLDDTDLEGPEAVVFALQRATGATVGAQRQLRLEIGTPPISAARSRAVGTVVTVEGIVTRARGRVSFIQDGTAAIGTFANGNAYAAAIASGAVAQGDRVQIKGELQEFNSLLQIGNIESFNVLSRGNALPAPQTVTLSQIAASGDALESELIRVTGLTLSTSDEKFDTRATSYDATNGGSTVTLRTSGDSEILGLPIQPITGGTPGAYGPFTFTGVLGQFRDTNQLNPIRISDFSR